MRCDEIMQTDVCAVYPQDSVQLAAALMRDQNIGFLPVIDPSGRPLGVLTDRDITVRMCAVGGRPHEVAIGDIMTREVVACLPEDELRVAERLMRERKTSRVVVVDPDGALIGVIALTDVAALDSQRHAARTLRALAVRDYRF